jgi:hypothetical protein
MDKVFDLPSVTMELEDWILTQKDGDKLVIKHIKTGNLAMSGLLNEITGEMYVVAERRLEE